MKLCIECLCLFFETLWILLTDKEQRRQYNYDLGTGEIEP